jgi:hypothetical protein
MDSVKESYQNAELGEALAFKMRPQEVQDVRQ